MLMFLYKSLSMPALTWILAGTKQMPEECCVLGIAIRLAQYCLGPGDNMSAKLLSSFLSVLQHLMTLLFQQNTSLNASGKQQGFLKTWAHVIYHYSRSSITIHVGAETVNLFSYQCFLPAFGHGCLGPFRTSSLNRGNQAIVFVK